MRSPSRTQKGIQPKPQQEAVLAPIYSCGGNFRQEYGGK
jgi:hypothetical protein